MATGDPGGGHPLQDDQSQSPHSLDPQRPVRRSVGNMLSVDNDDGNPAATPVYSYASAVNQGTPVSISSFSTGNARTRQLEEFAKTDSTDGGDDGMKDFPSTLSTENTTYQPTSIGMVDRSKPVQQPSGKFPQQTYSQAASTEAQSMQHCTSTAKLGTVDQDSRHSPSPGNDVQHRECSLTSHATSSATAVTLSSTTLLSESPNSAQLSVVCEGCDEDATCRCLTCQLSLCNECWEDMHRVKKRASHRKVDLLSTGPTRPSSQEPGPFLWDENVEDNYGKDKFDTKPLPAGNITKPFQVYHLIQLHHDLQEQGETVKKWLLDKKTFTRFTSSLGLAENKKSSWPVDSDLQARELATIGLYGNKERISEWLKQRISLCPTDVKMITDESRPGLYCLNNGGNVQYLVFNAPEDAFAMISRKSISCLLIRCLVELCRPLLIFYSKDELSSFQALPNFGQEEEERVKAAIVKRVTGAKEEISLKPGFSVGTPRLDISDAHLCRNSNTRYFHAGQRVPDKRMYGKTEKMKLYGRNAKEPIKGIMQKLKTLSEDSDKPLYFSDEELLCAERYEGKPQSKLNAVANWINPSPLQLSEAKRKVLSGVVKELKQHISTDSTLGIIFEEMTFYKAIMQLELRYKMEQYPNGDYTRQLYSIEVAGGDSLAKLKQDPDHVPSLHVLPRPSALPLREKETLRYFTVLKTGKLLAAIEPVGQEECKVFLLPPADFTYKELPKPIFSNKKSVDIVDFDEDARLMAVHIPSTRGIEFVVFQDGMSKGCSNGSYHYGEKIVNAKLTQLLFARGGQKLHLLFDNDNCYTYDVKQRSLKPRYIEISVPTVKAALVTPDGSHLLIAATDHDDEYSTGGTCSTVATFRSVDPYPHESQIYIYSLATTKLVKTLSLPSSSIPSYCLESLQLMSIGSQAYLVALDKRTGTIRLCLTTIKGTTTSIEKTYEMSDDTVAVSHAAKSQRSWNYLDYFHYMYEKFSIEDYFKFCRRRVDICCIVDDDAEDEFNSHVCDEYVDNILEGLDISTRKPRRNFRLSSWYLTFSASLETQLAQTGMSISEWLQRIVCLLPVQIARADANKLSILESGLERDSIVLDQDFPEVYNAINFGLYEDIIKRWPGRVKVMSSMGKQSTGKSYLLNHAAGAMFDISGHRCTKGLWMTMRTMEDCLYVILDFEGLGSVKRTSQEDTLLSVTNAVISGLTVFKTEWAIYKETCEMLNQFKKGVELMKNHPKLLCGWFYVNVRDVKTADCQEVHQEFEENFDQIVNEDPLDNFLIRLYKSQRVVHTFPPIQEPTFYNNIDKIVSYLKSDKTPHLDTGAEFLDMFKQTLAKVHCGVWTDFQDTIIQQKVFHLEQHLETAIANGSIIDENGEKEPLQTDSAMEIPDEPLLPNSASPIDNLPDISISLGSDKGFETLIAPLMKEFEHRHGTRSDADDVEDWTNQFQDFLTAICKRREHRIEMWLQSYVGNYVDGRIDELRKTIRERLEKQELKLCTTTCKECQLPCLQRHRHDATSGHNCLGDHLCHRVCTFCSCSNGETSRFDIHLESKPCVIPAGHRGHHDCSRHTCGKACDLSKRARCRLYCKKKRAHDGKHDCGEPQHLCNEPCKVAECQNKCLIPVSSPAPDSHPGQHNCGTNGCLHRCVMCANPCASDHFHTPDRGGHHFCAKEHDCPEPCNVPNTCRTAYVNRLIGEGRRRVDSGGKTVSVEEKVRDRCGIKIPRNRTKHERPNEHRCGASTTAHTCCAPCPMCHRLCKHPAGHSGRHKTEHGYMWRTVMASATAEFNVGDKKIKRGESGMDQLMCQVYCEKLGRGHTHLVECGARNTASGRCNAGQSEGKRHCADDVKFSDNDTVPKDELMHHAYWEQINFEDPTSKDDQEDFKKCNYRCASKAHDGESPIWCKNQLWHGNPAGDQILQGHKFTCKHAPYHHILLLDTSWSMDATSPAPTDRSLAASHPTRLGVALQCAIQYLEDRYPRSNRDIFSIIPFDDEASPPIRREGRFTLSTLVEELKKIQTTGLTSFNKAFEGAIETMQRFEHTDHQCIIVFLTDGLDEFDDRILERYLQHRKDKTLPLVQMQTILISDSTSTESEVLKRIVNIVKKCYPRCDFATESRAKTYKEAAELVDHYHEIASRINVRGGFMSADVLERAGHRS
eukprot:scpid6724/ scgid3016/ 